MKGGERRPYLDRCHRGRGTARLGREEKEGREKRRGEKR